MKVYYVYIPLDLLSNFANCVNLIERAITFPLMVHNILSMFEKNTCTLAMGPCLTYIKPCSTSTTKLIFIKK